MFERLELFKLRINRKKSVFACAEVRYLGHKITPNGIETDPSKIAAISDLPEPRNIKHLKSFIQTCACYRKFVPQFSNVARPLTDLLKKNAPWQCGEEQRISFHKLKELLTSAPILKQADKSRPYILNTDARNYAIGGVLLQEFDGD